MTGFLSNALVVKKVWGWEFVLVNNSSYCFKVLHLLPGFRCSLHYHRAKDETFVVQSGRVKIEIDHISPGALLTRNIRLLKEGDSMRILPGVPHRFQSFDGQEAIIYEVSTEHRDGDVVRLEESAALNA